MKTLALALVFGAMAGALFAIGWMYLDCAQRGGELMRGMWGRECVVRK